MIGKLGYTSIYLIHLSLIFQFGQCSFGVKCQFAHGRADQRVTGKVSDFCANLSEEEKQERIKKAEKAPEYKTKLCQNFEDRGDCEFKELCLFAHGKGT